MINAQTVKRVIGLAPISTNNAAVTPLAIDTAGYAYAKIRVIFGVIGSAATVLRVTECDTSGGTYTAISGTTASGTTGNNRLPQTTDAGKEFVFHIPLGGARKRYLNLELTTGTTTLAAVAVELSKANVMPDSNTEAGVAAQVFAS